MIQNTESLIKKLFSEDGVHYRMGLVTTTCISHHRVLSQYISRLSDWESKGEKSYELQTDRPIINKTANNSPTGKDDIKKPLEINDHRKVSVRSVIDIHAWDKANWKGVAYACFNPPKPPCLALAFENEKAGRSIFERWLSRFGSSDQKEEIYISIVRDLPSRSPHHYYVLITSNVQGSKSSENRIITIASRHLIMEPSDSNNLENFLTWYKRFGAFYLVPAILNNTGVPKLLHDLAILKRNITIRSANELDKNDIESTVLNESLISSEAL